MTDFNGATSRGRLTDDLADIMARRHLPLSHIALQTGRCIEDVRRALDGDVPMPIRLYVKRKETPAQPNPFVRPRRDSWWTPEREEKLVKLWKSGVVNYRALSVEMTKSRNAVKAKVRLLKRRGKL